MEAPAARLMLVPVAVAYASFFVTMAWPIALASVLLSVVISFPLAVVASSAVVPLVALLVKQPEAHAPTISRGLRVSYTWGSESESEFETGGLMKTTFVAMLAAIATVVLVPSVASAQKPVSVGEAVSATFTIAVIDSAARIVTLEDKDGITQDVYCGPEIQRFDQLKVGDKVTFRYYESLVSAISRPGAAPAPSTAGVTRSATGATISQQKTVTVTINAIDPKVPSVTVTGPKGNKMSFKVDKKNIEGYKAGDKVDITYTQALAISVTK